MPPQDDQAPPVPPRRAGTCSISLPERRLKCVLVGDGAVGKTSLIVSYTTNGYPSEYIPTAIDHFSARVAVDGRPVQLQLCDMAGQVEFERLRPLCYHDADVFLLCYSIILPASFRSVAEQWAPEVHRLCPGVPVILVGTQSDLREDVQVLIHLAEEQERPVSEEDARLCAQTIGAVAYVECSALTQKNLKEVFDTAIVASLQHVEEVQEEGLRARHMLREKAPDKIKQLSVTWWRKLSCFM
ncbi:rho-related GTP-binding protein RhoU [Pygocentrus nattereri]|uniref:Ras homolog family member U n=1 Tax=Pygocentrus nattereri TaxID=42514 RepID=A0AAR2IUJ1_PYGNA|nr:rho-related GTP-binding protein RhoU [Pygocentrus nattereri]